MNKQIFFMCIFITFLIILLGFSSIGKAQVNTWAKRTDMPTARSHAFTGAVNGKIYVIGGKLSVGKSAFSSVEEYDPATDTWTTKTDMPTLRAYGFASVVNGKIYAIGGAMLLSGAYLSTVEEYDPSTDTWTKKADMPTPRQCFSTAVVGGRIYAIGGNSGKILAVVEEYDPVTDTWIRKADMPTPRADLATCAVNGKIYAIGGWNWNAVESLATLEEYDPVIDKWTKKADMLMGRDSLVASAVNGRIYAIGGSNEKNEPFSNVEEYDPKTNRWIKKADMPTARRILSTEVVNGYIYAIGGESNKSVPTVEVYDAGVGIWVTRVSPEEGLVTGNEPVAIIGGGFPPGVTATIGGKQLTGLKVADTLIYGIIPPGIEGEQSISIAVPGFEYPLFAGKFFYQSPSNITITKIIPTNGKLAGGDTGSISGSGFQPDATVTIGGVPATNIVVIPNLIIYTIPPGTEGVKDVVVTNPDGQKKVLCRGYTYNPAPIIDYVHPDEGPLYGGTIVTITGENFMPGVVVTIEGQRVSLYLSSSTELRFQTPRGTSGPKMIRVTNPDGQEAVSEKEFNYNPALIISSVKPSTGSLEGNTEIKIIGEGFTPFVNVFIGDTVCLEINRVSSTEIIAITPPSNPGAKNVKVVNNDGQQASLDNAFTYNVSPQITRVIPNNGKLAGGTKITIEGSGFLPGAEVMIIIEEGISYVFSSIQVLSSTTITAVTPQGKPGTKDVRLINGDGQETRLPGSFTYNPMPTITRVTPNYGSSSGGSKIIIEGTGFLQGARVMIGEKSATTQVKDDITIEAVTSSNRRGVWNVRVVNPDTQEAVMPKGFISIGELVYNYPNPFRASQGTTFRYVTNATVQTMTVRIFNLGGIPIDIVRGDSSNEVRWQNGEVHVGLYVYDMEVKLTDGSNKHFKAVLEVRK